MPVRDIVLTVVVLTLLPVCFLRPWIGVLVWSWLGYMNPHRLTWSFAAGMPFALLVALATLAGLLFTRERRPLPRTAEVRLLLALWALFVLTTFTALYPDEAWEYLGKVSKILLMVFVTLALFQDVKKVRALLWVIGLSIGFFGLKGGIWALATGGGNMVLGPEGSFIAANTDIGLALNMVLPLLVFLRQDAPYRWLRHLMGAMVFFSVVATIFTYSRGAVVALGVVLAMLLLKSRAKVLIALLLVIGFWIAPSVVPEKWFARMDTIRTYKEDGSAMGRLTAWRVATRIANDRPLLGAGFRPFTRAVYAAYLGDDKPGQGADAHSIFFQVLAEHGYTGLGLYVALMLSTFVGLRSVMREAAGDPAKHWLENCARTIETCLVGYVVGGLFLSLSYFDLYYHFVALAAILKTLVRKPASLPVSSGAVPVPVYAGVRRS